MMVKLSYIFSFSALAVLLVHCSAFAETPDWVEYHGKSIRFPDLSYLTGFGIAKLSRGNDRAACSQLATENAKRNLVEKIRVTIQNTVLSRAEERDNKYSAYFSTATQSTSSLELQGLETENYFNADDAMCYGLIFVNREKLGRIYGEKAVELRKEIRDHLASGKRNEDAGHLSRALDEYLSCYPLCRALEETQTIITAAQSTMGTTFAELEGIVRKDELGLSEVRQAVDRIMQKPLNSIDDLAWYIAYSLKSQTSAQVRRVFVSPFTYQDTRMGSPFSRYLFQLLQSKAVDVAHWEVAAQALGVQLQTNNLPLEVAEAPGPELVLAGTYWEQVNAVKFLVTLRRVSDGRIVGSTDVVVPVRILQETKLSLKPQNFKEAYSDQKQFKKDEIVGGGLSLEVWTSKGSENLIFAKGERMQAFVRVNMACYIRFVYHLADGRRALLLGNHYVDESKVNSVYQIPVEFECDEPFGAEVLQVFARTEKFDPVETEKVGEYEILKESLHKFLTATRGMKIVRKGATQTERRVVITTISE